MLRIIAGKYRHLLIKAPEVTTTRPTTDKVREALMSIIGEKVIDAVILDLFAGSGALGLESLSRGGRECYFLDKNFKAYQAIKNNIETLKIEEQTHVNKGDFHTYLKSLSDKNIKFDIVYLDPPYKFKEYYQEAVDLLIELNLLSKDCLIVKESDEELNEDERFVSHKKYHYGIVYLLLERTLK